MKSFLKVCLFLGFLNTNIVIAGEASDIINDASNNTIKRILALNEKSDIQVRKVIEEELMPYVDHKYASFKTLGKNYKKARQNKNELKEFISLFRESLLTSYTNIFKKYTNEKIVILKESGRGKMVNVYANIVSTGNKVKIVFKMRKNKKTGKIKLYDIVAEGISLIDSKRSEYSSIINKEGFSNLIKLLKSKLNKNEKLEWKK